MSTSLVSNKQHATFFTVTPTQCTFLAPLFLPPSPLWPWTKARVNSIDNSLSSPPMIQHSHCSIKGIVITSYFLALLQILLELVSGHKFHDFDNVKNMGFPHLSMACSLLKYYPTISTIPSSLTCSNSRPTYSDPQSVMARYYRPRSCQRGTLEYPSCSNSMSYLCSTRNLAHVDTALCAKFS